MKIPRRILFVVALAAGCTLLTLHYTFGPSKKQEDSASDRSLQSAGSSGQSSQRKKESRLDQLRRSLVDAAAQREKWLKENPGNFSNDWPQRGKLWDAIRELAANAGADGLRWIKLNSPEDEEKYLHEWMVLRPREMLDYVESSTERPCNRHQVQELLQVCANGDGAALRSECQLIPWNLFFEPDDPSHLRIFPQEYAQGHPDDGYHYLDAALWGSSGAARDLAEKGIEMYNFFEYWTTADPRAALENCLDWPDPDGDGPQRRLMHSLDGADAATLAQLPDDLRRRMKDIVQEIVDEADDEPGGRLRSAAGLFGIPVKPRPPEE